MSQYVHIDGEKSAVFTIKCVSFFGPQLPILHTKDFKPRTRDLKFIQFTHDSTYSGKDKYLPALAAKINTGLHKVIKSLQINRFSVNVSKLFFIVFSNSSLAHLPVLAINGINFAHSPTKKFF